MNSLETDLKINEGLKELCSTLDETIFNLESILRVLQNRRKND
jgi:hypothetical protein